MTRAGIASALAVLAIVAGPAPAAAQDEGLSEVVVTAMRRDAEDYTADMPAVGLRRRADFAVAEVTVTGDSRDKAQRENEIYDMIRSAIAAAPRSGVQLAYGDRTLQPLTLANYRELLLMNDSRPDSQRVAFLVKVPLTGATDAQAAQAAITAFVKAVKPVGRALMNETGDLTLSVVAPDQYRGAVADAIAADAQAMAARLGPEYGVEIEGLNRPVEWARAGLSEVLLYVPYKLVLVPKR
ncbi:TonB-dependent receptor [Novosphingobium soli]|uniref:TonB-dependent receptor n=1 Tax=Novosphingobium soli TaxID=574956 RepID=A0ABV6CVW8_9SPHN